MKILVTGGNGFIGSHLVDRLLTKGYSVTVIDHNNRRFEALPPGVKFLQGDLKDESLLETALKGIDLVYHFAWTTIHESSNKDPVADAQSNLVSSIRLIQACNRVRTRRLVFLSSGGTVYGMPRQLPLKECDPQYPISSYGILKLAVEKYLHLYNHLHGFDFVVLRPSVPYGPRQDPSRRQGAVAVFLYRVSKGLPVYIWGDGTVTRDYFYVSDLVDGMLSAAECQLGEERVFNLGGGAEISLNKLLRLVEETVGKNALVDYRESRKFDVPHLLLDTSLADRDLQWAPQLDIEEGLARTWSWLSSRCIDDAGKLLYEKAATSI